jgi:hypothetical protein
MLLLLLTLLLLLLLLLPLLLLPLLVMLPAGGVRVSPLAPTVRAAAATASRRKAATAGSIQEAKKYIVSVTRANL